MFAQIGPSYLRNRLESNLNTKTYQHESGVACPIWIMEAGARVEGLSAVTEQRCRTGGNINFRMTSPESYVAAPIGCLTDGRDS